LSSGCVSISDSEITRASNTLPTLGIPEAVQILNSTNYSCTEADFDLTQNLDEYGIAAEECIEDSSHEPTNRYKPYRIQFKDVVGLHLSGVTTSSGSTKWIELKYIPGVYNPPICFNLPNKREDSDRVVSALLTLCPNVK